MGKVLATSVIAGLAAALATVLVLKMLDVESSPAITGGVAGAVCGTVFVSARNRSKGATRS